MGSMITPINVDHLFPGVGKGERPELYIVLPVPPPLNKRLNICKGRMRKSREDWSYKNIVAAKCFKIRPYKGDVSVDIIWYRKMKAGDIDGRLKALLDALTGYAWVDDKQVKDLRIRIDDTDRFNPRMSILIRPLSVEA